MKATVERARLLDTSYLSLKLFLKYSTYVLSVFCIAYLQAAPWKSLP